MARKKTKEAAEFVLFDVLYEDGTLTSNRRVPSSALGGLEETRRQAPSSKCRIARSPSARAASVRLSSQ